MYFIYLLMLFLVNWRVSAKKASVKEAFEKNQLVPDIIPVAPKALASVEYSCGVKVNLGNELTPTQVKDEPIVKWNAKRGAFYTLAFIDPDSLSREDPSQREWKHWLVTNIPGSDQCKGEVLAEYIGSGPAMGSGFHRYTFLVYKQSSKLKFDEMRLNNTSTFDRPNFNITSFAKKYSLIGPLAGNFYRAQYDDYVPILYKQIGLST